MDLDFGDELSEDWVSQPGCSAPPSTHSDSLLADSRRKSTSRPAKLADADIESRASSRDAASLRWKNGPLGEMSFSDINATDRAKVSGTTQALADSVAGKDDNSRESSALGSDGTVNIAKKPSNDLNNHNSTPEWRRRLVNGQRGADEHRDLFSSREIERIFNKPEGLDDMSASGINSPKQRKSMLPQPVASPVARKNVPLRASPNQPEILGIHEVKKATPEVLSRQKGIPLGRPGTSHLRSSRAVSRTVASNPRQRQRSQTVPRQRRKASYDDFEVSERPSSRSSDSALYEAHEQAKSADQRSHRTVSGRSVSGPWLRQSTGFVTTRRGNADTDDSFFTRPLSVASERRPANANVDKHSLTADTALDPPLRSPTSPLKLFVEDDSFTSRRLHRRVSQLELKKAGTKDASSETFSTEAASRSVESSEDPTLPPVHSRSNRRVSNFGAGELDEHSFEPCSSALEVPTLEIEDVKRRVLNRYRVGSGQQRRMFSRSLEKRTSLNGIEDQANTTKDIAHADKKRILAAPHPSSLSKKSQTSRQSSGEVSATTDDLLDVRKIREASLAGRKRKDARYDVEPGSTPEEIALREILEAKGHAYRRSSQSITAVAVTTPNELFDDGQSERKKSLTTADFFNEANMIMQKIRAQDFPRSSLASAQQALSEVSETDGSLFHEEFTIEQLSRPASREGTEQRKQPTPRVLDARIVSHLRKFEDKDDFDLEWSSSSRPSTGHPAGEPSFVESDPPNVRIRERLPLASEHDHTTPKDSRDADENHNSSRKSSAHASTVDSIPTGSSRGSGAKATISPDKVSHLINLTMGGMTFDSKRLCWVKQKVSRPDLWPPDVVHSDMTEDDPLRDIPDLTVNESQEIRTTRELAGLASISFQNAEPVHHGEDMTKLSKFDSEIDDISSAISESHRFTSSGPTIETRATSWGDPPPKFPIGKLAAESVIQKTPVFEQTAETAPLQSNTHRKTWNQSARALSTCLEETTATDQPGTTTQASTTPTHEPVVPLRPNSTESLFTHSTADMLNTKPDHRIVELESTPSKKLTIIPSTGSYIRTRNKSMQLVLTTPETHPVMTPASHQLAKSAGHYSMLRLTPLPDFTVHQPDESLNLDMDYAVRKRGLNSLPEIQKNFSLAIEDLVEKITDIEPHEPYWEHMRQLSLKGQKLWTLHMLADFCARVEELDVSNNELGQLNGAPRSLQVLSISHNQLSSLTAWAHLPNLQYLNVSHNQISSLKSFSCLVHLRELDLTGNVIQSLDGIEELGNLVSLSIRGNCLKKLDLRGVNMRRLKTLDAGNNQIEEVFGLEGLDSLRDLNLRDNSLTHFTCSKVTLPRTLRRLDLSSNQLTSLDITDAPQLDSLSIDRNEVQYIKGLSRSRSIRKFSWRHQGRQGAATKTGLEIDCCRQVHLLDLSKNKIPRFAPRMPFLNLRRLELASCGIEELGEDFATKMPNLRVIDLNDNGIRDIRPLIGLSMLEELYIARNRLTKLRLTAKIIREFARTLRFLDCRDNPVTLGFYPAAANNAVTLHQPRETDDASLSLGGAEHMDGTKRLSTLINEGDDAEHVSRLDEETLLRRRVYEALLLYKCKAMVFWDGLGMEYRRELDRESMWSRLVELGVLNKLPEA